MKEKIFYSGILLVIFLGIFAFCSTGAQASNSLLEKIRSRIQAKIQITEEEFQRNLGELKQIMEEKRTELRNRIQQKREDLEQKRIEYQNQLRERLQVIKNETKKKNIEKFYERVNALNQRITNHYLDVLDHLEDILLRIESRTAKASLKGLNVEEVEEAIQEASSTINDARTAVKSQAEKLYSPPEITDEQNLKIDVGKLRQQLHSDLKEVEKLVKLARDRLREAAVTLAQIKGVNQIELSTTTNVTPLK